MARFGTVTSGSFAGGVTGAIWTEIRDVLIPQMTTYNGGTTVRVPVNAGKWEGHIVSQNHDHLRIDLQGLTEPRATSGVTWQAGSNAVRGDASPIKYANWQVQFGPHGAKRATFSRGRSMTGDQLQEHKGSIAGVHMALANDFTIAEIQRAFQLSYDANVGSGNTFGVLLPTGAYTEPVVEVAMRWIVNVRCRQTCKANRRPAFKMNLGKKEDRLKDRQSVDLFLANALGAMKCPNCSAKYALELEGTDPVTEQQTSQTPNWRYNFNMDSYELTAR